MGLNATIGKAIFFVQQGSQQPCNMKLSVLFSHRHNNPIVLVVGSFLVQLLVIAQLCASFGGRGLVPSAAAREATSVGTNQIPYRKLATVIQEKLSESEEAPTVMELTKTLSKLASNQQTFKGLDGVAHEAYQRTHSGDDVADTSVSGRAQRSATRLAAVAEAFHACELVEVAEHPELSLSDDQKEIILNVTLEAESGAESETDLSFSVIVIHEPKYAGGMGLEHGNLLSLTRSSSVDGENRLQQQCKGGRLLVVVGQKSPLSTTQKVGILDATPKKIKLSSGLVTNEVASVQPVLYKKAGELLSLLEPQLRQYNTSSVHFVGHSLAGGVANLAATILDGSIPMPKKKGSKKKSGKRKRNRKSKTPEHSEEEDPEISRKSDSDGSSSVDAEANEEEEVIPLAPLNGLGRARSSAMTLGSPPCLSSNVLAAFCTSFIYGDDIICRTTEDSISRLEKRIERTVHGGFIGKKLGWMSDTMSLTVSSLQSHAHGSEGEETRLAIPGRAFLVRPRRLGGICSIHEVGNLKKGGREALREALLWQMNDVLLSTSMWKHHELKSYIQGLDRTQLRGVVDDDESYID